MSYDPVANTMQYRTASRRPCGPYRCQKLTPQQTLHSRNRRMANSSDISGYVDAAMNNEDILEYDGAAMNDECSFDEDTEKTASN